MIFSTGLDSYWLYKTLTRQKTAGHHLRPVTKYPRSSVHIVGGPKYLFHGRVVSASRERHAIEGGTCRPRGRRKAGIMRTAYIR